MFDFKSIGVHSKPEAPSTLAELFSQLDRKTSHSTLRPVQVSAFKALDALQTERDLVLKMSTGSGKTVVALTYAEMMRRRYKGEPSVILCPTNQLVDQLVHSGSLIGVPVTAYGKDVPYGAFAGDSVLACTYDRVFNARSAFDNRGIRPSSFVLDDVHAGIERVRGCFTVSAPDEIFEQVLAILRPLCEGSDPAAWHAIASGSGEVVYEVPYWVWSNVHKQVFPLLDKYKDDDKSELFFRWGNICRYLELARVCVTGRGLEFALPIAAVEENAAFSNARHRLFMSASIKDGSSLVADLGCSSAALQRIIELQEDEGAGERMILPTSLIASGARKEDVAKVCSGFATNTNVVVLTSSSAQSAEWVKAGATLYEGKLVDAGINRLRTSSANFAVFPQRFDGVDLPDDACRVLVIDGVPSGDRLCDKVDAIRQKDSPEYDIRTVNRFEQALGRAVRSNADYAATVLVGPDIASFIGRRSVREILEGRTRAQVDLGKDLANMKPGESLPVVLNGLVNALLGRDEGWKEAHRTKVKAAPKYTRALGTLTVYERVAEAERNAWLSAKARNFQGAVTLLRDAANLGGVHPVQKAELLYRIAWYLHQFDPAAAVPAYRSAFEINSNFPRPDQAVDKRFSRLTEQAATAAAYFAQFSTANAALARLDEIKAKLSFGMPADVVEQGLLALGEALGAISARPEKETGRGPDNLWLFDEVAMCIEAKSEKTAALSKTDAGQLMMSHRWSHDHVDISKENVHPVFATNSMTADRAEDIAFGPMLLSEAILFEIVEALRQLVTGLAFDGPLFGDAAGVSRGLASRGLTGKQILARLKVIGG
ncbi:MAG: DEAD/DEAH box helicase family protein [Burkholderiales bacterium]|nr:DEAD/DEAH box helicase family protein [Burkholderiales bacterium]MDE1925983.1 DEAD/DEAH box helicase family protein [Burkholderiales bacterium]